MRTRQLKLVTGEELICEVLDEHDNDIIIRNALTLKLTISTEGTYYYRFNPFMSFQGESTQLLLLVSDKILSLANPSPELLVYYEGAMKQLNDTEDSDHSMEDTNLIDSDFSNISYH